MDSGALEVNIRSITGHEPQCCLGSSDPHHVLTSQCEEMKSDPGHFSCWKSFRRTALQQGNAYISKSLFTIYSCLNAGVVSHWEQAVKSKEELKCSLIHNISIAGIIFRCLRDVNLFV